MSHQEVLQLLRAAEDLLGKPVWVPQLLEELNKATNVPVTLSEKQYTKEVRYSFEQGDDTPLFVTVKKSNGSSIFHVGTKSISFRGLPRIKEVLKVALPLLAKEPAPAPKPDKSKATISFKVEQEDRESLFDTFDGFKVIIRNYKFAALEGKSDRNPTTPQDRANLCKEAFEVFGDEILAYARKVDIVKLADVRHDNVSDVDVYYRDGQELPAVVLFLIAE